MLCSVNSVAQEAAVNQYWITTLISLSGVVVSIIAVKLGINTSKKTQEDKLATKDYVDSEIKLVSERMSAIEEKSDIVRDDVKYVRGKIDSIFLYLMEGKIPAK